MSNKSLNKKVYEGILTRDEILKMIRAGEIKILVSKERRPFDEKNEEDIESLQPTSFDMKIGNEAYLSGDKDKTYLSDDPLSHDGTKTALVIGPSQFGKVCTLEWLELSKSITARIGFKSDFAQKALIFFSGPIVDPGYKGNLRVGVYNPTSRNITLPYKEPFLTLEFHRLKQPAPEYEVKEKQGIEGIGDLRELIDTRWQAKALDERISVLEKKMSTWLQILSILMAIIMVFIAIIKFFPS